MPRFLPVRTQGNCAIAICDRCRMKHYYSDLKPDPNSPGLRVCEKCRDVKDPYRFPARKTENISLKYPRPDSPATDSDAEVLSTESGLAIDFPPEISP